MDDQSYYYQRAEQELTMAQNACCQASVHAHYILANHYLDRSQRMLGEAAVSTLSAIDRPSHA